MKYSGIAKAIAQKMLQTSQGGCANVCPPVNPYSGGGGAVIGGAIYITVGGSPFFWTAQLK